MRSHTYTDDLARQGDLQPGMDRHHREWNGANGVREPAADLSQMAEDVRNRLIDRVEATAAGDRTTARTMLEAVQVIKVLHDRVETIERDLGRARAEIVDRVLGFKSDIPWNTSYPERARCIKYADSRGWFGLFDHANRNAELAARCGDAMHKVGNDQSEATDDR